MYIKDPLILRERLLALSEPQDRGYETPCRVWTGTLINKGYGRISTRHQHKELAHRVAYAVFREPIPEGAVVRHKCDVPACIEPSHLELGSQSQNCADALMRNRQPNATITPEQVREIRTRYATGEVLQKHLAAEYGVSVPQMSKILNGKRWSWLD